MSPQTTVAAVDLSDHRQYLRRLIDELIDEYGNPAAPRFLDSIQRHGARLPGRLGEALQTLREGDGAAALILRRGPVADVPGPTPLTWRDRGPDATLTYDFWLALVAGQMGDPFCWSTLQGGRLFTDILPIRGEEQAQTGHGSGSELLFHVEDAFHDRRCDTLALLCLRNDDGVPTMVASVECLDLDELDAQVLFDDRFVIRPDPEHLRDETGGTPTRRFAVLTGHRSAPRLRVDPAYCAVPAGDAIAAVALSALHDQLKRGLVDVVLNRGDLLLLENRRAVHGRRRFSARYDGTDRWLRRMTVLRALRRRPSGAVAPEDRVIHPFVS